MMKMKVWTIGRGCLVVAVFVAAIGAFSVVRAQRAGKAAAAAGNDWPNWRGPDRSGISAESGWKTKWPDKGPKRLWRASVGKGFSSFAVAGGRAYTMGNADGKDTVFCFDAKTGEVLWKYSYACEAGSEHYGTRATPTVDGNYVYTHSRQGHLYCLTADTGKKVWSRQLREEYGVQLGKWALACSPVIVGDKLILDAGMVLAFNKKTGKLIWKSKKVKAGYATPSVFKQGAAGRLACFNAAGLAILDLKTGKTLMTYPWKTAYDVNAATPIVSGGKVFISSGYRVGCALIDISGEGPKVLWRNKNMSNHCNSCVLYKGYIYGFNGNVGGRGRLTCLDPKTGKVKWSERGMGTGSVMIADGKLIVMGERGDLVVAEASPAKFKALARAAKVLGGICWTTPVLSNGRIYCRNSRGDVVCLDVAGT